MQRSESTLKIDAAILAIQQELEPIVKNKVVRVDGEKFAWSSGFATFGLLHAVVKPMLAKHEITLYQYPAFVPGAGERFFTRLSMGGEFVEADYPVLSSKPGPMGYGAGRSFAKRWGLLDLLGIVAEDAEERQGYQDQRAPSKAKQRAPQGINEALESIRTAKSTAELHTVVSRARASFPTEAAVERTLTAWLVAKLDAVPSLDYLVTLKDLIAAVQPRGVEVREALNRAGKRLEGGS